MKITEEKRRSIRSYVRRRKERRMRGGKRR